MNSAVTTEKLIGFSKSVPYSLLACYVKQKARTIPLFHAALQHVLHSIAIMHLQCFLSHPILKSNPEKTITSVTQFKKMLKTT